MIISNNGPLRVTFSENEHQVDAFRVFLDEIAEQRVGGQIELDLRNVSQSNIYLTSHIERAIKDKKVPAGTQWRLIVKASHFQDYSRFMTNPNIRIIVDNSTNK